MMREAKTKYGVVSVMMMVVMIGVVAALDGVSTLGLFGMAVLFFTSSAVLLFCLMKLEVMDFREGSFWYALNQQVNAPKRSTAVARNRRVAPTTVRKSALAKGM